MSATTTHLMTAEELFRLPDDGYRHELIKGELLTMSPPGAQHGSATGNLAGLLYNHVTANNLGRIYVGDTGFKLEVDPDTVLAPDIAIIARPEIPSPSYHLGPPDIAIEVRSQWDRKGKIERKTALWLELGAKSVWNVDPRKRTVEVVRADGNRWLHESDELVDDTVPGFRVAVSKIFE